MNGLPKAPPGTVQTIKTLLTRLSRWRVAPPAKAGSDPVQRDLVSRAERARREWQDAQQHFQWVTDPVEVEHAVYWIKEAERKYVMLWQQARRLGVHGKPVGEKCQTGIAGPAARWYNQQVLNPAPTAELGPPVQGEEVKPGAPI